ncbi:helix-turn-helix domain-containing protein [Dietzia kunjamensis]|uniref:helix-turn-helix domain-containing protein n=1 Tax=Dietzia kunjamensis TaxID=322509 RepID=UPI0039BD2F14
MSAGVEFYTVAEIAAWWRCDKTMVYDEIRAGRLRAMTLGTNGKRIATAELARYERERAAVVS